MKKALITGITGQDGSYLAELLIAKGYEVYGIIRRVAIESGEARYGRINHILHDIQLRSASVENFQSMFNVISEIQPDEIYHLAAQSFVADSFQDEFTTLKINIEGTHNILSIIKRIVPKCKFYFAASSEMFGAVLETPQTERTPFNPQSTYAISKCAGFHLTKHYRDTYGIFALSGMLFNHESPRRGVEFVTRKITTYAAKIKLGVENVIPLGNIEAKRDWGHARDYVEAMHLMLMQDRPEDYLIATGETHTVCEFLQLAFEHLSLDYKDYVLVDEAFKRPSDVNLLIGDASKAKEKLDWTPKTTFKELVREMVEADLNVWRAKIALAIPT